MTRFKCNEKGSCSQGWQITFAADDVYDLVLFLAGRGSGRPIGRCDDLRGTRHESVHAHPPKDGAILGSLPFSRERQAATSKRPSVLRFFRTFAGFIRDLLTRSGTRFLAIASFTSIRSAPRSLNGSMSPTPPTRLTKWRPRPLPTWTNEPVARPSSPRYGWVNSNSPLTTCSPLEARSSRISTTAPFPGSPRWLG
jgi:hypothetical protein